MHTVESLKAHPHLNPDYFPRLMQRKEAQAANRELSRLERIHGKPLRRVSVPKQVNRYLPHQGAKESVRHLGKDHL